MTETSTTPQEDQLRPRRAPVEIPAHCQVIKPEHTGARIVVLLQPEEKYLAPVACSAGTG